MSRAINHSACPGPPVSAQKVPRPLKLLAAQDGQNARLSGACPSVGSRPPHQQPEGWKVLHFSNFLEPAFGSK